MDLKPTVLLGTMHWALEHKHTCNTYFFSVDQLMVKSPNNLKLGGNFHFIEIL